MSEKKLKGKVVFITGASRGIGREMALRFAKDGAIIIVAAKTSEPHATLSGTIHTVAKEIEEAGGTAYPIQLDIRDETKVYEAVADVVSKFGKIDILINNASAISLTPTLETPMKRFDLMFSVNARGTFLCSQACIPHMKNAENPHIINLSPPLNMKPKWFAKHVAYTISKYGMSMCTLGMSVELKSDGIAVNSLWPKTTIATAAIEVNFPKQILEGSRKPQIMADAAYEIVTSNSRETTGNFFVDEDVLRAHGMTDFGIYAVNPEKHLFPDFFLD
ncbi:MAG: NAD(P)-dependent oxidoreductase [Gammaproteobacteria bacterium]|nr:NAD(P)-dependent oxidoreductase [Gammaproteobacteria bacterium]